MASIAFYIFILLAVALIVIVTSIILYNRRLDKIARGEEHDTHSKLPEPGATAGITYRTVVMILLIITVLSISALLGKISSLQSTISNQQTNLYRLSSEVQNIGYRMEQSKTVYGQAYEVLNISKEANEVEVRYWVRLRQFSDDTKVILTLNGRDIELLRDQAGVFAATFKANLFETYLEPTLQIVEGGITTVEDADFYGEVFWEYFPTLTFSCEFNTSESLGKYKYSGWYQIQLNNPDKVRKVQLTYISGGKEILTKDITKEALASERFELEKDLKYDRDLVFVTEITTADGYKLTEETAMIFPADPDYDQKDSMRIYDKDGNLIWENEKLK